MALSNRARRFVELIAVGEHDQGDCYLQAGYSSNRTAAIANSSRLIATPEAQQYLAELRERTACDAVMDLIERRTLLRVIAQDEDQPAAARVSALQLDSKLAGDLTDKPAPQVQIETLNIQQLLEATKDSNATERWEAWADADDAILV